MSELKQQFSISAFGKARFEDDRSLEVRVYQLHNLYGKNRKAQGFVGWLDPAKVSLEAHQSAYPILFSQQPYGTPGTYRHNKTGELYKLLGNIRIFDSNVHGLVLYRGLYDSDQYGKQALWIRPATSFFQEIELGEKKVTKFEFQKE